MRSIILLLTISTLIFGCSQQVTEVTKKPSPEVDVSQPISTIITEWDEYTGRFSPVEQVEIRARVSGYLNSVNFKDGQMVNKGDVLFVIDQRSFKIALRSALSRYEFTKKELDRGNRLRDKKSISQEEVDRRFNEFETASATLDRAKLEMEFTEIKSPIDGLASRNRVNVGNLVNGSTSSATLLTTIVSIDPIHFYFEAGERDLLKYIRLSQNGVRESSRTKANPVKVRLQDEENFSHEGVMDFVDNRIGQSTGTIQARAILDNPGGYIVPGIFGRIRLLSQANIQTLLIPDSIIGTDQSNKFVYILDEKNNINRKFVTLGKLHTRELRIVKQGLAVEDNVIVNGLMRLRIGMTVTSNPVDLKSQYTY